MSFFHQIAGHEPGDPAKAAQAIIAVVNAEQPPRRLLLGRDAVQMARQIDQAKLAETDRWERLSASTDFDDVAAMTNQAQSKTALQSLLDLH